MPDIDPNKRQYFDQQLSQLKLEFATFEPHYRSISKAIQPTKGRFFTSDRNDGRRRWQEIINNVATRALRVAVAGMFAGTMNPARPWFTWDPPDPVMKEFAPVKEWIDKAEKIIFRIFAESNFYNMAPQMLKELILFGTGAMHHDDDFQDVARYYTHTVGSYMIGQDERYVVNRIVREFEYTTEQLVSKFGLSNVSQFVRDSWDRGNYHHWHKTVHFIEPNPNFNPNLRASRFKPFRSVYYEDGGGMFKNRDVFLSTKGFDEFPAYVPRWDVTGEDVYATDCPGMTALGDTKQLQLQERRKAQAIEKEVNPPLTGPAELRNYPINAIAGGVTLTSGGQQNNKLEAVYNVQLNLQNFRVDMDAVEERIKTAFYNDLFLAISQTERGIQPKNQLELSQRDEERLIQLGPVLGRIHMEFLKRVVDRTFNQAARAGILPPAPPELQGKQLQLRFISAIAMAQRSVERTEIETLVGFTGQVAGVPGWEQVTDKIDIDQAIDKYAEHLGAPPSVIVPDEIVAGKRAERQKLQQEQNEMELAQQAAQTAKLARDAQQ